MKCAQYATNIFTFACFANTTCEFVSPHGDHERTEWTFSWLIAFWWWSKCTSDIADERADQKTVCFAYSDWPSQSIVLILRVAPFSTDLMVSNHACSSVWYLPNDSCKPQNGVKVFTWHIYHIFVNEIALLKLKYSKGCDQWKMWDCCPITSGGEKER